MANAETLRTAQLAFLGFLILGSVTAWAWAISLRWRGEPLLPAKPAARRVPWSLGSILALISLYLLLVSVVPYATHRWIIGRGPSLAIVAEQSPEAFGIERLLLTAFINAGMIVLSPALLRFTSGATLADFGLNSGGHPGRNALRGAVGWLLFTPVVYGFHQVATFLWKPNKHPLEETVRAISTPAVMLLAAISALILAPAAEELIFRGVIQGCLRKLWPEQRPAPAEPALLFPAAHEATEPSWQTLQPVPEPALDAPAMAATNETPVVPSRLRRDLQRALPNLVTSALFASAHVAQWPAPVAIFALSLVLGALYQRTGSIVGPFVLHALFNGVATVQLFTRSS